MEIELLDEPVRELTVIDRAQLALKSTQTRTDLAAIVAKSANIKEIKNADGRAECHAAAMVLVKARTTIKAAGKAAREDATKFSNAIIAEENSLVAITAAEEKRLMDLRDAWDQKIATEKALLEKLAQEQADRLQARIDNLAFCSLLIGSPSAVIQADIDDISAIEVSLESFGSRAGEAQQLKQETLAKMAALYQSTVATEQAHAELERQQEALRAAQKKLEDDQAAAAAARAAEDKRLASLRDQLDADLAAARQAEQAKIDEAARVEREAAAAAQKILDDAAAAERQRLDEEAAEQRAKLEAEAAAAAEVERLAAVARNAAADAAFIKDQRVRNAAPALLASLQECINCLQSDRDAAEYKRALQAIKQATGE